MKTLKQALIGAVIGSALIFTSAANAAATYVGGCSTADLTSSTDCSGVYAPGNDNGVNTIFPTTEFVDDFGTGWILLGKNDLGSDGTAGGITLTGMGSTSGTWSVDAGYFDGYEVIGILKAGNAAAGYLMDTSVTSGTWDVTGWMGGTFQNGLSHLSFWVRDSNDTTVPAPGLLALMGLGLVGFAAARKAKKA